MTGIKFRRDVVRIYIVCNYERNGLFAGRAFGIRCGDNFIELDPARRSPPLAELDGSIRLAGKCWPVLGSERGLSNGFRNGYWMRLDVTADFFVWLHGRKLYDFGWGDERLMRLWEQNAPLDRLRLWRLMDKAALAPLGAR